MKLEQIDSLVEYLFSPKAEQDYIFKTKEAIDSLICSVFPFEDHQILVKKQIYEVLFYENKFSPKKSEVFIKSVGGFIEVYIYLDSIIVANFGSQRLQAHKFRNDLNQILGT